MKVQRKPFPAFCLVPAGGARDPRHKSNVPPVLPGGTAMLTLTLLGARVPLYISRAWRAKKNRATWIVMLAFNAVLIVTAFGPYYLSSES
jgi:hypothetical protein